MSACITREYSSFLTVMLELSKMSYTCVTMPDSRFLSILHSLTASVSCLADLCWSIRFSFYASSRTASDLVNYFGTSIFTQSPSSAIDGSLLSENSSGADIHTRTFCGFSSINMSLFTDSSEVSQYSVGVQGSIGVEVTDFLGLSCVEMLAHYITNSSTLIFSIVVPIDGWANNDLSPSLGLSTKQAFLI